MLNLHALRLFHVVAELGSVTKAAERLNVSQPAVTGQIKKLERELGLRLFSPRGRGILLTDSGRALAAEAIRLFSLEADIERAISRLRDGTAGVLTIAATYLPANYLLPDLVAEYKSRYPDVNVRLSTVGSARATELLLRYEADLAVVGGARIANPLLKTWPWRKDDMWFVAHAGHRLAGRETTLADIVSEPFASREEGSYSREQLKALCLAAHVRMPEIGLETNGYGELLRVVAKGYGIAYLSALEAREEVERGTLRRIVATDAAADNLVCAYCRDEPGGLSVLAEQFLSLLPELPSGGMPRPVARE
ncbi:LysR family transcriptional regulator [Cohnella suwonensis]|uniref:LysR family transcriptional regulator n=1 Tax=Cohnella suwonensis TaxID=696072 RepID=A0ABW0LUP8_9BACL